MKAAVPAAPASSGIGLANWKGVRQFVQARFGRLFSRRGCWNYLRRLGFVVKRPKKRLLKANVAKRAALVAGYGASRFEAQTTETMIIFVDEAHFRADVDVRAKWVLRGEPAFADSTSPGLGERATYYSGVAWKRVRWRP